MLTSAAIFPGQGSQSIGMLAETAKRFPQLLKTFSEASSILGYDIWKLCQEGPEDRLNQTEYTQPAILVASIALWRIFEDTLNSVSVLAGHSLGEYSALVCAKALAFEDAVKLVQTRGKLMQTACAPGVGAMAAIIGLSDEVIKNICQEASQGDQKVDVANFNSFGQGVIAGNTAAVEAAVLLAKHHKAKIAKLIPVSVPAHSFLMKPAAEKFAQALAQVSFHPPSILVLHNVNADVCKDIVQLREVLVQQLYLPVRWTEIQQRLASMGIQQVWEVGPGKVLCGLAKRTIPGIPCQPIWNST